MFASRRQTCDTMCTPQRAHTHVKAAATAGRRGSLREKGTRGFHALTLMLLPALLLVGGLAGAAEAEHNTSGKTVVLGADEDSGMCRLGYLVDGKVARSAVLNDATGVGILQEDGTALACWSAPTANPYVVGLGHDYGVRSPAPRIAVVLGDSDHREARLKVHFLVDAAGARQTVTTTCRLANGIASEWLECVGLEKAPTVWLDPNPADGEASLVAQLDDVFNHLAPGALLVGVSTQPEVTVNKAEAYFDFWTFSWYCAVEEQDLSACIASCGHDDVSVSAEPVASGPNPFAEPHCEVSCDCNDGRDVDTWIDPPQVQGPGGW